MLIDLSEYEEMANKIGDTKIQILQACLTPKRWSDLVEITDKAEPTLLVHVNDLVKMGYLDKKEDNRTYLTTNKGVEFLELVPHVRPIPKGKVSYELIKMFQQGIHLGYLSLRERLEFNLLPELFIGLGIDKSLRQFYVDVVQAIRQSVTLWLPKGLEPDRAMYLEVNRLIGKYLKANPQLKNGKVTMVIEFDLPQALDMVARQQKDEKIREKLIENRDKVLKILHENWDKMFK